MIEDTMFDNDCYAVFMEEEHEKEKRVRDNISRQAAIDAVNNLTYPSSLVDVKRELVDLPSAEPLVLTCDGCRHVGTYDTDFPCSRCIRREKDYYEQER